MPDIEDSSEATTSSQVFLVTLSTGTKPFLTARTANSSGLTDLNATPHKDAGFVYLTNQRVLFMGLKSNIEWSMKTMVTPMPLEQQNIIGFQCTDHSGIGAVVIVPNDWYKFYFYTLMVFGAQKKLAEVLSGAESQLKQYTAVKPA